MLRALLLGAALAELAGAAARADAPAVPAAAAPQPVLIAGVVSQKTVYGDGFADSRGMTLYTSDQDSNGKSACNAGCDQTWIPFSAARIAKPVGDWSIVHRDDGSLQWALKGKPLYTFTGDHAPGDAKGDGVNGSWHAVVDRAFVPAGIVIRNTEYGPTFTTADGRTLYMEIKFWYNAGSNGTVRHQPSPPPSACSGDCEKSWAPFTAPKDAKAAGDWTLVDHDDGSKQWAWKGHPLYTYLVNQTPGDISGEGHWVYIGNEGTHWEVANIVL
jgi:predicted lipoprotein with Yx(FWY)xxD motif